MRKFEIIIKPLTSAKLTINQERITLKLPDSMDESKKNRIVEYAKAIDSRIGTIKNTLRGRFHNNEIKLTTKYSESEEYYYFLF